MSEFHIKNGTGHKHIDHEHHRLKIKVKGSGTLEVPYGTTIGELAERIQPERPALLVAAVVNNVMRDRHRRLERDCELEMLDINSIEGNGVYQRTAEFLLIKACRDVFPSKRLMVRHSISNGLYCELLDYECTAEDIVAIESRMRYLCEQDMPIHRHLIATKAANAIFAAQGQYEKIDVLRTRGQKSAHVYELDGFYEYFYGHMLDRTGLLNEFNLLAAYGGLILQTPRFYDNCRIKPYNPRPRLAEIFREEKEWVRMLKVPTVGAMNRIVRHGSIEELIRINEALHEKKIALIADNICHDPQRRVVLISGPSSSGKTTFTERLKIQMQVNGRHPVSISLDNYFIDKVLTPLDEKGDYDFESLDALKLELFNEHLSMLLNGEEIEMPVYNFIAGNSNGPGIKLSLPPGEPVVIEGIHALNDRLTSSIAPQHKYKIYISALTQIAIDYSNRIPTADVRLLRRMIRDHRTRGYEAVATISHWHSVRRGEEKNIFPYQENADIMFNSALTYELAVIKPLAVRLLRGIDASVPEYVAARRILKFLSYFEAMQPDDIPATSILREFIGGSCFHD
ncbi:MAG: nucleoside kinase [Syntrophomonadaceae bacterium]|nr:nucleoside kinase [Syntrophomonadaceae bacterium]